MASISLLSTDSKDFLLSIFETTSFGLPIVLDDIAFFFDCDLALILFILILKMS